MYVYAGLGLRVSEGSKASRKYVLESGKTPERVRSSGVNTESSGEVHNMESLTERVVHHFLLIHCAMHCMSLGLPYVQ
jgi:hypothetical protein